MMNSILYRLVRPAKSLCLIALFALGASTAQSQILFDINGATTTGNVVSQTVPVGGVDFELTVTYTPGIVADLFDLGGGDEAFFSSNATPVPDPSPFRLSLTQDGVATNFTLNQIDFASFGSGISFDIVNDNGDLITNDFAIPPNVGVAPTGSVPIDNPANATDVQFVDVIGSGIGSTIFTDFHNIVVTPSAIPEPSSLVGIGLLSISILVRRKRR